jgi:hypothetical protein
MTVIHRLLPATWVPDPPRRHESRGSQREECLELAAAKSRLVAVEQREAETKSYRVPHLPPRRFAP